MCLKICVILLIIHVTVEQAEIQDWDLAVTINDQIKLLTTNGTLVGTTLALTRLKALTFDNVRHQFIASDMNQHNDTIYSISLKEQGNSNVPVVQDLPDDIQGLAIDPLTDILYWTDPKYKSIHSVPLNDPDKPYQVFMKFEEKEPQDLAIDSCRRHLYFTNSFSERASIDRVNLNTKKHEVLIDSGLHTPVGIAIDYVAKKLYWSDSGPGIYFRIESATLEGKEREIVIYDTHQLPFGLAVDSEFIYWTDINNNALWKRRKDYTGAESGFHEMRKFEEKPLGIIAKHLGFAGTPDCESILELMNEYNESTTEYYQAYREEEQIEEEKIICLNNGQQIGSDCKCPRSYTGPYCEIPLCYNLCMHGRCAFTAHGYPKCVCNAGYSGSRCETNICDNFCLNNGTCAVKSSEPWGVKCNCRNGFLGSRCEINSVNLCDRICSTDSDVPIKLENFECTCRGGDSVLDKLNTTEAMEVKLSTGYGILEDLKERKEVLILSVCTLVLLIIVATLLVLIMKLKKKSKGRPRVNKRIIVNKNVTPLTYRPHSEMQECEITIENCCNMNVCETPCFEPPQLRKKSAKDEQKKKLLTNMENPDELC